MKNVTAADQKLLTRTFTEKAVSFIERHRERPFFVYLAHPMPHVPLFVSDQFESEATRGLYTAVISELDWSVGRIVDTLDAQKLTDRTIVIVMSDNGPWIMTAITAAHRGRCAPASTRRSREASACRSLRAGRGTSRRRRIENR